MRRPRSKSEEARSIALPITFVGSGVCRSRGQSSTVGNRCVPEHLMHGGRLERQPTKLPANSRCFDQRHLLQCRWVANIVVERPDVRVVMAASEKDMHAAGDLDEVVEGT